MNEYEMKQERRRERLTRLMKRLREEGQSCLNQARRISDSIPIGQPILVGHHSEGRHRRALDRIQKNHRKGWEKLQFADKIEHRLLSFGQAISSDDPEAIRKLKEKLAGEEANHKWMKKANAHFRKHGNLKGMEGPEELKARGERYLRLGEKTGFPGFALSNSSANIQRTKKRIEYLTHKANAKERPEIVGPGFRIVEDKADNRIHLKLEARLTKEDFKFVRSCGWLWSPTRQAFVRQLNTNGQAAAEFAARELTKRLLPKTVPGQAAGEREAL